MAQGLSYLAVRQPIFIEKKKAPGHKSLRVFFIIYSDFVQASPQARKRTCELPIRKQNKSQKINIAKAT